MLFLMKDPPQNKTQIAQSAIQYLLFLNTLWHLFQQTMISTDILTMTLIIQKRNVNKNNRG